MFRQNSFSEQTVAFHAGFYTLTFEWIYLYIHYQKRIEVETRLVFYTLIICVHYLHPVFPHPLIFSFPIYYTIPTCTFVYMYWLASKYKGEYEWCFSFWDCVTLLNITYRVYPFSYKLCDHVFSLVLNCVCVCLCVHTYICTMCQIFIIHSSADRQLSWFQFLSVMDKAVIDTGMQIPHMVE